MTQIILLFKVVLYYPLINLLTFLIWLVPGHNAAWGIIIITLLVRFALIVPSKKAAQSQRRMQELQPLIEELKVEYGDDKQGLSVAQMDLYKKNNINPFGSCLPLLIQLPVLIILYQAIIHGLEPNSPYLYHWLVKPPFIDNNLLGISLIKPDSTYILPILAAGLQFFQTRLTIPPTSLQKNNGQPEDPSIAMQKNMMYIFPILTLIIAKGFPAGVALYWVVTTLFSVVQQYYVNKENLKLKGVESLVVASEDMHPKNIKGVEKALKEIKKAGEIESDEEGVAKKEPISTSSKKGVKVTVRKKQ
jgi:YidC/Oxa1 family membrane protein insertase